MDTPSMAVVLRFSQKRERPALAAALAGAAPGATGPRCNCPAWRSWPQALLAPGTLRPRPPVFHGPPPRDVRQQMFKKDSFKTTG